MSLSLSVFQLYEEGTIIASILQIWKQGLNVFKQRAQDHTARFKTNLCVSKTITAHLLLREGRKKVMVGTWVDEWLSKNVDTRGI